jgi:hypothetical protein
VSQKSQWRRFVETRRRELHDAYPWAMPTHRNVCPKHGIRVPQTTEVPEAWVQRADGSWRHVEAQTIRLTGICKPCRDELYEQLIAEYRQHHAARRAA